MRVFTRIAILAFVAVLMLVVDVTFEPTPLPFDLQLVPETHAVAGRQRRTRRRGAAVGYAAGKSSAEASQQQQQQEQQTSQGDQAASDDAQQGSGQQQAAAAPPQQTATTAAAAGGEALPQGVVVNELPQGCTQTTVDGVQYYHDGTNYYRAAFQGNQLVYVTTQP